MTRAPPVDGPPRRRLWPGQPPRPTGPNLLGRMLRGSAGPRHTLALLDEAARTYGDVIWTRVGPASVWILRHPDDIDALLVGQHQRSCKDALSRDLSVLLGNGLLTSHGPAWRRHRRLSAPYFSRVHVTDYSDAIIAAAQRTVTRLRNASGRAVDLHHEMASLALDIVVETLFGARAPERPERIGELVMEFTELFTRRRGLGALFPVDGTLGDGPRMREIRDELWRIIDAAIAGADDDQEARLLHHLGAACDDTGRRFPREQLRDELMTLFLAGHETTALALTFALREIGLNAALGAALSAESQEADPELPDRARLAHHALARDVILESMRLYPPAWTIGREIIKPIQLRGWTLEPGAQVLLPQWLVHRDPRWFDAPHSFDPARWSRESRARPRGAYFPFGGGPRICIGQHFALIEATLALAELVRDLRFETEDPRPIPLMAGITLRPTAPVLARVTVTS